MSSLIRYKKPKTLTETFDFSSVDTDMDDYAETVNRLHKKSMTSGIDLQELMGSSYFLKEPLSNFMSYEYDSEEQILYNTSLMASARMQQDVRNSNWLNINYNEMHMLQVLYENDDRTINELWKEINAPFNEPVITKIHLGRFYRDIFDNLKWWIEYDSIYELMRQYIDVTNEKLLVDSMSSLWLSPDGAIYIMELRKKEAVDKWKNIGHGSDVVIVGFTGWAKPEIKSINEAFDFQDIDADVNNVSGRLLNSMEIKKLKSHFEDTDDFLNYFESGEINGRTVLYSGNKDVYKYLSMYNILPKWKRVVWEFMPIYKALYENPKLSERELIQMFPDYYEADMEFAERQFHKFKDIIDYDSLTNIINDWYDKPLSIDNESYMYISTDKKVVVLAIDLLHTPGYEQLARQAKTQTILYIISFISKDMNDNSIFEAFDFHDMEMPDEDNIGERVYNSSIINKLNSYFKNDPKVLKIFRPTEINGRPVLVSSRYDAFSFFDRNGYISNWSRIYWKRMPVYKVLYANPGIDEESVVQKVDDYYKSGVKLAMHLFRNASDIISWKTLIQFIREWTDKLGNIKDGSRLSISPDGKAFVLELDTEYAKPEYKELINDISTAERVCIAGFIDRDIALNGTNSMTEAFDFSAIEMNDDDIQGTFSNITDTAISSGLDIKKLFSSVFGLKSFTGAVETKQEMLHKMPVLIKFAKTHNVSVAETMRKVVAKEKWPLVHKWELLLTKWITDTQQTPTVRECKHMLMKMHICPFEADIEHALSHVSNMNYEVIENIFNEYDQNRDVYYDKLHISPDMSMFLLTKNVSSLPDYYKNLTTTTNNGGLAIIFGLTGKNIPDIAKKTSSETKDMPKRKRNAKDDKDIALLKKMMSKCSIKYKNIIDCEFGHFSSGQAYCHMWGPNIRHNNPVNIELRNNRKRLSMYRFRTIYYNDEFRKTPNVDMTEYQPLLNLAAQYDVKIDAQIAVDQSHDIWKTLLTFYGVASSEDNEYGETHIIIALRDTDLGKSLTLFNAGCKTARLNPIKESFDFSDIDTDTGGASSSSINAYYKQASVMPVISDEFKTNKLVGWKEITDCHLACPYYAKRISHINTSNVCKMYNYSCYTLNWHVIDGLNVYILDEMLNNNQSYNDAKERIKGISALQTINLKYKPAQQSAVETVADNLPREVFNNLMMDIYADNPEKYNQFTTRTKDLIVYLSISPDFSTFIVLAYVTPWRGMIGLTGHNIPEKCLPGNKEAALKAGQLSPDEKVFRKFMRAHGVKIPTTNLIGCSYGKFKDGRIYFYVEGKYEQRINSTVFMNSMQYKFNKDCKLIHCQPDNEKITHIFPEEIKQLCDNPDYEMYICKSQSSLLRVGTGPSDFELMPLLMYMIFKDKPNSLLKTYAFAAPDVYKKDGTLVDDLIVN